jgi:sugar phosphate isomerase/epimerase
MTHSSSRRDFLKTSAAAGLGLATWSALPSHARAADKEPLFKISVTEYSVHRMIGKKELDNLEYAAFAKKTFGVDAVEYWNSPFFKQGSDEAYLKDMRKRADDAGVKGTCILIDGEGALGDPDETARKKAVENHRRWIVAAKILGCPSIRVNAQSKGTLSREEQAKLCVDGLSRLGEIGEEHKIAVIVENHGGLSSDGEWLAGVMKTIGKKNVGTLPDFGNFGGYDRYKGTAELMPYAKLVSAKSHDFDDSGNETKTDYRKMMKIVLDAGYHDYVGIEYEGGRLPEVEGVLATKRLLEKVRDELAKST